MKVVFGKYEEIDIKNYESMQCEAVKIQFSVKNASSANVSLAES